MSEPGNILGDALRAEIKEIVREALREERAGKTGASGVENDTLLTAEEAAAIIGVNVRWMYRHAPQLSFSRRINRKNVRFSASGLHKWLAAKKPDFRR
jgi:predicted DNA-binding transcriptional regulator AlpA